MKKNKKLKICIYAHSFPPIIGGAQTYQYNLAIGLGKLGHKVLVVTGEVPDSIKNREKEYVSKYFKVIRLPLFRDAVKMNAPFKNLLISSFNILKEFKPDIVYSNGYIPCLLISMIKDSFNFKHIFSYHSTPELDVNKMVGIFPGNIDFELSIARFIFNHGNFDSYLACSNNYLNTVITHIKPNIKNTNRIYYGVDMEKFSFKIKPNRKKYGFNEEDFIILCPVRFIERKGILDILNAISILKKSGIKKVKLFIPTSKLSTNDKFIKNVFSLIKRLNIQDNVCIKSDTFLVEDMPNIYAISDIVVLPSYSEGLGIVLLEAMSMKKPVVASKISGVEEVVINKKTGLVVPIKSPKKLSVAISYIYKNKSISNILVSNAYSMIRNRFELNKQIKKVEQLFLSVYEKK